MCLEIAKDAIIPKQLRAGLNYWSSGTIHTSRNIFKIIFAELFQSSTQFYRNTVAKFQIPLILWPKNLKNNARILSLS